MLCHIRSILVRYSLAKSKKVDMFDGYLEIKESGEVTNSDNFLFVFKVLPLRNVDQAL